MARSWWSLFGLLLLGASSVGAAPQSRWFRMGFTGWPPEYSLEGLQRAARFLAKHGDLVSVMVNGGLPWQEALDGKPFPAEVQRRLQYRPPAGHRLFLSVSLLDNDRRTLAPYFGERENMPLPAQWVGRPFDSPEVIGAATSFCLRCADEMKPDYMAIGVESNVLLSRDRVAWQAYKRLHRAIYKAVKARHPQLPVFFTTEMNHLMERATEARGTGQLAEVRDLMRSSDLFAMSYYPHMSSDTGWPIPADPFPVSRTFGKPIAVSETGMSSRQVTTLGVTLRGSPGDQRQYYEALLAAAERDRYRFVVTFAPIDYDRLLGALPKPSQDLARVWAYTGLEEGGGEAKPALAVWDRWLAKALKAGR